MSLYITLPILVYLFSAVALRLVVKLAKKYDPEYYRELVERHSTVIDLEKLITIACLLPVFNTAWLILGTIEMLKGKKY